MEAAHTPASLARLGAPRGRELLRTGTTTVLTMETVHDTDAVFEAIAATGMRATIGKCMMDADGGVPRAAAARPTRPSIDESLALQRALARRGGRPHPRRIRAAVRGLVLARAARSRRRPVVRARGRSCTRTRREYARRDRPRPRSAPALDNIAYLAQLGLASPRLCAAHCVWVDDAEQALLAEHDVKVLHCPGSNLKLGSGVAPVAGDAGARHRGVARRRRRRLQQPPRHVRRDAAGRDAAGRCGAGPAR